MSLLSGLACVCVLISRSALVGAQPGSSGQPSQVAAAEAKQGSPPARQATAAAEVTVAPVGPLGEAQALYLREDFEGLPGNIGNFSRNNPNRQRPTPA